MRPSLLSRASDNNAAAVALAAHAPCCCLRWTRANELLSSAAAAPRTGADHTQPLGQATIGAIHRVAFKFAGIKIEKLQRPERNNTHSDSSPKSPGREQVLNGSQAGSEFDPQQ